ncbi:MAG: helix-turn-helix transcriptional regulator [Coxiellaceae bacterium]|nr:helix-turn-helix transcriptional regulator [Coxiellaceae bacterium]
MNGSEIRELVKPYLQSLGIKDMAYSYFSPDRSRSVFTTNPEHADIFNQKTLNNIFKKSVKWPDTRDYQESGWHTPEMYFSSIPENAAHFCRTIMSFEREQFGLRQVLTIKNHFHDGGRECFEFFSDVNNGANNILHKLDIAEQLTVYFKDKARDILGKIIQKPLLLSAHVQICNHTKEEIKLPQPSRYYLMSSDHNTYLTHRQAQCFKLLFQCYSSREIGQALCISMRTVENHIAAVKDQFNCRTKSELYKTLTMLGFKPDLVSI